MNLIGKICLGAALVLSGTSLIFAQKGPSPNGKIPMDPNVRTGKLANGLTYYVRHNQEPKDRASFYIVQNVGAVLENDNQNGLAHFLEHMAFNGTKNFPDKELFNYLEKYGLAFGRNINAYTNVDETVYNISDVPTSNKNLIDSALLVLHDWSNYLSLDGKELDKERGVIHEEWRTRRSGGMRINLEQNKLLFKGSKYAKRDIIGDLNVIDNFEHQVIRDFYNDWYRTDLQAVVVVGDIDAERLEAKIKEMFAHIPTVKNPKKRVYFDIPDNKEPIVGVITDPEASSLSFDIFYKHKATAFADKNLNYYRSRLIKNLYASVLGNRYKELLQKGNAPFIFAFGTYYNLARKMDVFHNGANLKEDNLKGGIEILLTEVERIEQHGIVASELERAKKAMLSQIEKRYKERNKQNNNFLAAGYKENFLTNEPSPGVEFEFKAMQMLLPGISVQEINAISKKWITSENMVITLTAPEKEELKLPSEKDLLSLIAQVKQTKLAPYVDKVITEPLISKQPKSGKIITEKQLDKYRATEWTLSNGAKVIIKQTDFMENQILFEAFSKGGQSLYATKDLPSVGLTGNFASHFGLAQFDKTSLGKLLTGKEVKITPYIDELTEGLEGTSSIKDFETLLQLTYLHFEQPRFDENAFTALKGRFSAYLANMGGDINKIFNDSVVLATTDHHPRTVLFNPEMIAQLDFETMKQVYKERFTDASDFTFTFVGNIDANKVKPLIETYIGSIKDIDRTESWKDNGVGYPKKDTYNHFKREMETPKTTLDIELHGDITYSYKNAVMMHMLAELLDKRYNDVIREEEGGTYGVGVLAEVEKLPRSEYNLMIRFDTDPAKAEKLKGLVYNEINNLFKKGIKADDLIETKKNFIKEYQENLRKNEYWINAINDNYIYDKTFMNQADYDKLINSITKSELEKFAKKYFSKAGKLEVIMSPKQKSA